ncbi:MAG: PorV/PorQ family protein [Elusimicrobia bacterium]|nr:PorV/PorQ family protein [Elusimicrobiota bacterium]
MNINCFRKYLVFAVILFALMGRLCADTGSGGLPGYYLDEGGGARPLAMGGAFTAVADDASAIYWNAAGLGRLKRKEFQLTHIQLFDSTRYDFASYAHPFSKLVLGLAAGQLYSGGIAKTDQLNNPVGTFADQYNTVYAGAGMELLPDTVYFGFAAKRVSRAMDGFNGTGYGLDAGLLAKLPEDEYPFGFSAGINVQNLVAPKIQREVLTDEFPLNAKAGVAFVFFDHSLTLAGDVEKKTGGIYQPHAGVEYSLSHSVAFRAGYDKPNPTFGFGMKFGDCNLDYALLSNPEKELGLSHRFSVGFKFGRNTDLDARVSQLLLNGGAYLQDKQWQNAEGTFQKALELDKNNTAAKEDLIQTYLAWADSLVAGEKPDRREALNICGKALKLDPENKLVLAKMTGLNLIAVADFTAKNVSQSDASIVADFLRTEMVGTGLFNVMDRNNMDAVLAEQKFQNSGCTDQECVAQMGKLLNVQRMAVGSLSKLLDIYYITVNLIDVETGKILASYDQKAASAGELKDACQKIVEKMSRN